MNNNNNASHCLRKIVKSKAYLVKNWVMIPEGLLSIMAWKVSDGRFTIAEHCFSLIEHYSSRADYLPLFHSLYLRTFNYCFLNILSSLILHLLLLVLSQHPNRKSNTVVCVVCISFCSHHHHGLSYSF